MSAQDLDIDQKREALSRLLESNTFARADQLRRFLRYICEAEMAGRAAEITEHSIAVEALGRSANYLPGDDSSVRNRAHALRQKLQEYYEQEEPGAVIRVELRKGSYVPHFVERPGLRAAGAAAAPATVEVAPLPAPPTTPEPLHGEPEPARRRWIAPFAAGAAAALAVAALVALLAWPRGPAAIDPVLREAWRGMLEPGAAVTICIASPPTMLLKSFRDGTLPAAPRFYEVPRDVSEWYAGLQMTDGGGKLYMSTTMNGALFGDSLAAVRAVRLLTTAGAGAQVLPEWGTRPLALRGQNLLLVGSPNYSPYAARILAKMPFTVRYDAALREEVISDATAKRVFRPRRNEFGQNTQVFGLLTVLPSHSGGDGREQTVVFSGITSAGPQAAMELFSSPSHLRDLAARMAAAGHGRFPPCYQVVVRVGVDRNLALSWDYETHEVVANPPSLD